MYRKIISFITILLFAVTTAFSFSASAFNLPDTSQTLCYDEARNLITCPPAGQPLAQDGSYNINPLSYRDNGDGTVTDMNTGLIWQKEDAGRHNYYQALGAYDSTDNPTSRNVCSEQGTGGYSDWRLPSKKELMSIVHFGITDRFSAAIDNEYFPNTFTGFYFTSTRFPYASFLAPFCISFYSGSSDDVGYSPYSYVRCVRGGEFPNQSLVDNGNKTVTDRATGLTWQQEVGGRMSWADSLEQCENLSLAGLSDWRLPNIKELESLTDNTTYDPAIDTNFFPNTYSSFYWTSTPISGNAGNPISSFVVKYKYGGTRVDTNSNLNFVRCVQGGESNLPNNPPIANCQDVYSAANSNCAGMVTKLNVDDYSYDPDGDSITLTLSPAGPYPLGITDVTLTASDPFGESDSCTATVTVVDDSSPNFVATASPDELWPPNHRMVPVTVSLNGVDNCDSDFSSSCSIVDVTSDEPLNDIGDGNTDGDYLITGPLTVDLRAERAGPLDGRVYTLTIQCADASGNTSTRTAKVNAPYSKIFGTVSGTVPEDVVEGYTMSLYKNSCGGYLLVDTTITDSTGQYLFELSLPKGSYVVAPENPDNYPDPELINIAIPQLIEFGPYDFTSAD